MQRSWSFEMKFPCILAVMLGSSLMLLAVSASAEEFPNPPKMPVPKNAASEPAPANVPQSQNQRMFLKYKGEPLSAGEIGKPMQPAPIVSPSKL
jgi:hypothetical protein